MNRRLNKTHRSMRVAEFFFCMILTFILVAVFLSCTSPDAVRRVRLVGGALDEGAYSIRQTSDGGYILAGSQETKKTERDMMIIKLTAAMDLDESFGDGGIITMGTSGDDQAIDVLEIMDDQACGKGYLAVGYVSAGDGDFSAETYHGKIDLALMRLDVTGRPDPAFDGNGRRLLGGSDDDEVIVHLNNYSEPGDRIVQEGDAFIIAAMTRSSDGDLEGVSCMGTSSKRDFLVFKIDSSGRLIRTFGSKGFLRIGCVPGRQEKQQGGSDFLFSIEAAGDGGFIGLGYTVGKEIRIGETVVSSRGNNDNQGQNEGCDRGPCYKMDGFAFRFDANGILFDEWGDHGVRFIGGTRQEKMYDVIQTHDGGFLMTGRTSSTDLDMAANKGLGEAFDGFVARLDRHGNLDPAFASYGVLILTGSGSDRAHRVCELDDGRIAILVLSDSNDDLFRPFTGGPSREEAYIFMASPEGRIQHLFSMGGSLDDKPVGMILNRDGCLVLTGFTESEDGVFTGESHHGAKDVFVVALDYRGKSGKRIK